MFVRLMWRHVVWACALVVLEMQGGLIGATGTKP